MHLALRENIYRDRKLPVNEDLIRLRISFLAAGDRDLLEAVLLRGQAATSLARLMGKDPRQVRRRVARLTRLLSSKRFVQAAGALPYLGNSQAHLATLRFCRGLSQGRLCLELGISRHELRRRLDQLTAQIEMVRQLTARQDAVRPLRRAESFSNSNNARLEVRG